LDAELKKKVKNILKKSEASASNIDEFDITEEMFYDKEILQKFDLSRLTLLRPGISTKSSPLVKAKYPEDQIGKKCAIDASCEIGKDCIGLKIVR